MKFASSEQMRKIDAAAQNDFGLSGELLMETAALMTAAFMQSDAEMRGKSKVAVFCGKGNNGGDGLALARILISRGYKVAVFLVYNEENYHDLAEKNLQRLKKFDKNIEITSDLKDLTKILNEAEIVVDALLGTGTFGEPREPLASIIKALNNSGKMCLALDIPTGVDPDFGEVAGIAVRADKTISFGLGKPGLYTYPGAEFAGQIVVRDIGFPPALLTDESLKVFALESNEFQSSLPRINVNSHKGQKGHVLIVGGSEGMTGAPILSSLAALRAGSGLVTLALRYGLNIPEKPPEIMTISWNKLKEAFNQKYQAVVCGPGLNVSAESAEILEFILHQTTAALVLDADALNILAQKPELLEKNQRPLILTPHPGEMARLTGLTTAEIQASRLRAAQKYAMKWQSIVVLKGARTIVALPDGRAFLNLTGSPTLSTAGSGDVLAGIIGSLSAQGISLEQAAISGVYLHGLAGEFLAEKNGTRGIIAGDLLEVLPKVYQKVEGVSVED